MKKSVFALFLACAMVLTLAVGVVSPASASGSSPESTAHADRLHSLHLFQGSASGYNLDAAPTRLQGLIMLTRLLGKESKALACTDPNPFTDVTGTGDRYAAYAYANGLTSGTGDGTTFTPSRTLSASNYVTFLLRALGYDDSKGDFAPSQSLAFAASIGMMAPDAPAKLASITMNRGDLVDLSYAALTCTLKNGSGTLAEKLLNEAVFTKAEGLAAGVLGEGVKWVYEYAAPAAPAGTSGAAADTPAASGGTAAASGQAIVHEKKTAAGVTANVLTVDPKLATVKTALVDNTLGHTAPFSKIVESSGAAAVINGNFFASYSDFKIPVGHVMVGGEFLYGTSGLTSLGITGSGEVRVGRPALFTRIKAPGTSWTAYEINVTGQYGCVMYTPAFGPSVTLGRAGNIMTVTGGGSPAGGTISSFQRSEAGAVLTIPAGGYLVYMDDDYMSADYIQTPAVGTPVTVEYYLQKEDPEGFTLDGLVSVVSGAPRLVQDGAIVTTLEQGFQEERFTTASSPRTAIGVNGAGKLLLISVPSATIQQMRELCLGLGCVDAFNVDGGASCAMYYNGAYIAKPGRELTVTLQVFPK